MDSILVGHVVYVDRTVYCFNREAEARHQFKELIASLGATVTDEAALATHVLINPLRTILDDTWKDVPGVIVSYHYVYECVNEQRAVTVEPFVQRPSRAVVCDEDTEAVRRLLDCDNDVRGRRPTHAKNLPRPAFDGGAGRGTSGVFGEHPPIQTVAATATQNGVPVQADLERALRLGGIFAGALPAPDASIAIEGRKAGTVRRQMLQLPPPPRHVHIDDAMTQRHPSGDLAFIGSGGRNEAAPSQNENVQDAEASSAIVQQSSGRTRPLRPRSTRDPQRQHINEWRENLDLNPLNVGAVGRGPSDAGPSHRRDVDSHRRREVQNLDSAPDHVISGSRAKSHADARIVEESLNADDVPPMPSIRPPKPHPFASPEYVDWACMLVPWYAARTQKLARTKFLVNISRYMSALVPGVFATTFLNNLRKYADAGKRYAAAVEDAKQISSTRVLSDSRLLSIARHARRSFEISVRGEKSPEL